MWSLRQLARFFAPSRNVNVADRGVRGESSQCSSFSVFLLLCARTIPLDQRAQREKSPPPNLCQWVQVPVVVLPATRLPAVGSGPVRDVCMDQAGAGIHSR
ncbi:hypothetical protein MRX96_009948 [Rhipicephalus microplus]